MFPDPRRAGRWNGKRKSHSTCFYVFLTDGFITNETAILEAIRSHPSQPVIFTFGAGNNLNRYFLEECAKAGNGFATPVLQGDAAGTLVEQAWKRIETPQWENVEVDFGGLETKEAMGPASNRLYTGLPYRITGKFDGEGSRTVTLTAMKQGVPVTLSRTVDFTWKDKAEVEAIRIYDLHGRLLFTWRPVSGAGAIGRWVWDGRDAKGSRLKGGSYLISVQTRSGTRNRVFVWGSGR